MTLTEQSAYSLGYEHGQSRGMWVIDGNTSEDYARKLIAGYDEGDPEVMDMQPSPLSGEWADDPLPRDILAELGTDEDEDSADDLLRDYAYGFSDGFWSEVMRAARVLVS